MPLSWHHPAMGRLLLFFVTLAALPVLPSCRQPPPSAEDLFAYHHDGRRPQCDLGTRYDDCAELASLETDRAKRVGWLERGCTHGLGDLCVSIVGAFDSHAAGIDDARAVVLLTMGCEGIVPGRACAELVYRRVSPLGIVFAKSDRDLDPTTVRYAERACFLGVPSVPMLGFGPTACFYVAKAYLEGIGGRPRDALTAAVLLEAGCEQELASGHPKAGPSCAYGARVYQGQPLLGNDEPDRTPLDMGKAKSLLQRGCANGQSDSCMFLSRAKP